MRDIEDLVGEPGQGALGERDQPQRHVDADDRGRRGSRPPRSAGCVRCPRGKLKALVAIAGTLIIIIWHLLNDRAGRYHDLGEEYYTSRIDTGRKARGHLRQLEALGYTVTVTTAA